MNDIRPFRQSPSRAMLFCWSRSIFPGPDCPAWRPLNPSLCLRPSMFYHAHRHRTAATHTPLTSFHPPLRFHLLLPALCAATRQIHISSPSTKTSMPHARAQLMNFNPHRNKQQVPRKFSSLTMKKQIGHMAGKWEGCSDVVAATVFSCIHGCP